LSVCHHLVASVFCSRFVSFVSSFSLGAITAASKINGKTINSARRRRICATSSLFYGFTATSSPRSFDLTNTIASDVDFVLTRQSGSTMLLYRRRASFKKEIQNP
jgi:uncharacterized membrane protein